MDFVPQRQDVLSERLLRGSEPFEEGHESEPMTPPKVSLGLPRESLLFISIKQYDRRDIEQKLGRKRMEDSRESHVLKTRW